MLVVLDFETFYSKDFTLKKLGVLQYVRDARFKIHGVGVQINDQPAEWWTDNLESRLKSIDWSAATLVGHNLYFDATILFEHYGIVPARRIDTMSMAKGVFEPGIPVNLNNVAKLLRLGNKIEGTLTSTKDIETLGVDQLASLGKYCLQDVALTRAVYNKLFDATPVVELDLIDITLRMGTAPILELNTDEVDLAISEANTEQSNAIGNSGVDKKVLSSNKQFAAHLQSLDLEVPTKISPTTGEETFALGQNDPEFIELMDAHPELTHLWEGRAAAKSNLPITRANKWHFIANHGSRKMPMPLRYYGAHTGRWSGMDGINVQNLPRGSRLRKAIQAPEGHVVLVGDSSQIELRLNAWFCNQNDILQTLREGQCVYRKMASALFNKHPDNISKDERQFGKVVVLGCGYGMGWRRFKHYCASGPLGMAPLHLPEEEAQRVINVYRETNNHIVSMWRELDSRIFTVLYDRNGFEKYKSVVFKFEEVGLPNGRSLDYARLKDINDYYESESPKWKFHRFQRVCNLWGGTLLENIIQALARIVVAEQMLLVDKLPGVQVVGCTHDEIIAVCPERYAEIRFNQMINIMSQRPSWAHKLPLAAEGGWARNYSK